MVKTIEITGIDSSGPHPTLILSDDGSTDAAPGDTVRWTIGLNSGVASITQIEDNVTIDIFNPDPVQEDKNLDSSAWSGLIRQDLTLPCEETYTIHYTQTSVDGAYRFDPKIQVNS